MNYSLQIYTTLFPHFSFAGLLSNAMFQSQFPWIFYLIKMAFVSFICLCDGGVMKHIFCVNLFYLMLLL